MNNIIPRSMELSKPLDPSNKSSTTTKNIPHLADLSDLKIAIAERSSAFSERFVDVPYATYGKFDQEWLILCNENQISVFLLSEIFTETLKPIKELISHEDTVNFAILHQKHIFSASEDKTIKIWDFSKDLGPKGRDLTPMLTIQAHEEGVTALVATEDYLVSGGDDCKICLWNLKDLLNPKNSSIENPIIKFKAHNGSPDYLQANQTHLYSASYGKIIKVWSFSQLSSGIATPEQTFNFHKENIQKLFLKENYLFSSDGGKLISVWNLDDKSVEVTEPERKIIGSSDGTGYMAMHGKTLFAAGDDDSLKAFDFSFKNSKIEKTPICTLESQNSGINFMDVVDDKLWVYKSSKGVQYWDLATPKSYNPPCARKMKKHKETINKMEVFDNRLVSASDDGQILVWNLEKLDSRDASPLATFQLKSKVEEEEEEEEFISINIFTIEQNKIISGDDEGFITIWSLETLSTTPINKISCEGLGIYALAAKDNFVYTNFKKKIIAAWDISASGADVPAWTLTGHSGTINSLVIDKKRNWLISGSEDRTVCIWELGVARDAPLRVLIGHDESVSCMALSGDILYTGDELGVVLGWDLTKREISEDREFIKRIYYKEEYLQEIKVQKDKLFTREYRASEVRIWDLKKTVKEDNTPVSVLSLEEEKITSMAPDGQKLYISLENYEIREFAPTEPLSLSDISILDDMTFEMLKQITQGAQSLSQYSTTFQNLLRHLEKNYPKNFLKSYPILRYLGLKPDLTTLKKYIEHFPKPSYAYIQDLLDFYFSIEKSQKNKNSNSEPFPGPELQSTKRSLMQTLADAAKLLSAKELASELGHLVSINSIKEKKNTFHSLVQLQTGETRPHLSSLLFSTILTEELDIQNEKSAIVPISTPENQNILKKEIFSLKKKEVENPQDYVLRITNFPLDISNGSANSILFFQMIDQMTNEQRKAYDPLINKKWKKVKFWLFFQAFIFLSMTIFFDFYIYIYDKEAVLIPIILLFNIIALLMELKGMLSQKGYFSSLYNFLDITTLAGVAGYLFWNNIADPSKALNVSNYIFTGFLNIRSIAYFRVIDSLRYLIEMVLKIYLDIRAFLTIISLFVLVYGVALIGVDRINAVQEPGNIQEKLKIGAELGLGNWDVGDDWNYWNWGLFIFSAITFTVILLNLIIAIVSATFEEYFVNEDEVDRAVKLNLILEIDQLLFLGMRSGKFDEKSFERNSRYFHILEKVPEADSFADLGEKVQKCGEVLKNRVEKMENGIEQDIEGKLGLVVRGIKEEILGLKKELRLVKEALIGEDVL